MRCCHLLLAIAPHSTSGHLPFRPPPPPPCSASGHLLPMPPGVHLLKRGLPVVHLLKKGWKPLLYATVLLVPSMVCHVPQMGCLCGVWHECYKLANLAVKNLYTWSVSSVLVTIPAMSCRYCLCYKRVFMTFADTHSDSVCVCAPTTSFKENCNWDIEWYPPTFVTIVF